MRPRLALVLQPLAGECNVVARPLRQLALRVVQPAAGVTTLAVPGSQAIIERVPQHHFYMPQLLPEGGGDRAVPGVQLDGIVEPASALKDVGAEPILTQMSLRNVISEDPGTVPGSPHRQATRSGFRRCCISPTSADRRRFMGLGPPPGGAT